MSAGSDRRVQAAKLTANLLVRLKERLYALTFHYLGDAVDIQGDPTLLDEVFIPLEMVERATYECRSSALGTSL